MAELPKDDAFGVLGFFVKTKGMAENNKFVFISNEKEVQAMYRKELFVVGAVIVMVMAMVMFFPVTGTAGSPDPPSPPILNEVLNKLDNIQGQLDNIPPAWSQTLQCDIAACPRFELVMDGAAVLDHETGLVWQKVVNNALWTWAGAINQCNYVNTGERWGWHLPTVEQLESLIYRRTSGEVVPKLPYGHPFIDVLVDGTPYWTATTYTGAPWSAYVLSFGHGPILNRLVGCDKAELRPAWCVRGGQTINHDQ